MNKKIEQAVRRYLEMKDYDVINVNNIFDFIVKDGRNLVFIDVYVQDNFIEPELKRSLIEEDIFTWVGKNDIRDFSIRYDVIIVRPMGDRAMIKHHISALSEI